MCSKPQHHSQAPRPCCHCFVTCTNAQDAWSLAPPTSASRSSSTAPSPRRTTTPQPPCPAHPLPVVPSCAHPPCCRPGVAAASAAAARAGLTRSAQSGPAPQPGCPGCPEARLGPPARGCQGRCEKLHVCICTFHEFAMAGILTPVCVC
jgi:hypothetical protein